MKLRPSLLCLLMAAAAALHGQRTLDLSGMWQLSLADSTAYNDYVVLPGSMLTNNRGDDVTLDTRWTGSIYDSSYYYNPHMEPYRQAGNMKFPFFLTPQKHYVGAAWYKRRIYVPRDWRNQRVTLFLERPHIETTVFVNGQPVGHHASLSTPHRYDVTEALRVGQSNEIAICVYNGTEGVGVGQDSHSVTDQTQGNWNGIVGRMELQAQWRKLSIKHVKIVPDLEHRTVTARLALDEHVNAKWSGYVYNLYATVYALRGDSVGKMIRSATQMIRNDTVDVVFYMGKDMHTWDEFHPNLYRLVLEVGEDVLETDFGVREIAIEGRQFTINRRPLFLRGTVENCCFPETGYPPTDVQSWMNVFWKCKQYGLNHVRFHSYCPPEAAFRAADRVGIYLQVEGPSWPNHGVKLRRGQIIDQYLLDESKRIIDEYGSHPSFVMMAAGNEPAGDWVSYCNDWVKQMHQYDSTHVYCGASVGGGWAWDDGSEYHVKGGARGLDWDKHAPSSDDDYLSQIEFPRNYKADTACQSPIIAHEQGQWCAFPDLKETSQYTGAYRARNFEIFRDLLRDNGMESMAHKFLMASGRLQTLCYKFEIERNLRTPGYAGFQLLGLNDYSGQGTALVGPLNVFWREKGYVTAPQWQEFCSPLVLLARFPKFVYTNDEMLQVPVEMMNAFYGDLRECTTAYGIWRDDTTLFVADTIAVGAVPIGKNNQLGTINVSLASIDQPTKFTLVVSTENVVNNRWDFWVYPRSLPEEKRVTHDGKTIHITDTLDAQAQAVLRSGGCVLLTAAGRVTLGSDVKQHYLPVFWNTSWFKMRPPHTTGAYIDKAHPLFRHGFPTDDWANLNWWELLNRAQVMNLAELPASYQPPIQPIDTWHVSRKLGMLIEARVLNGRLLMTTMDISRDLEHRVVARQMRHAVLSYMGSADFNPQLTLDVQTVNNFFTRRAEAVNMYTNDSPDELKPALK